jgi:hypothetical protein
MTNTLNQIIFFSLHQNQNIVFSNIWNQNIFLEKKHNPPPPSFKLNGRSLLQWYISTSWCEVEYPGRKPDWSLCIYLYRRIWLKTYLKTVFSKCLLTQLRSDIGLLFEAIYLSDFLKTAITLASFQNDGKHFFLRDKLNSLQSGRQIVFLVAINIRWLISSGPDGFCGSRQEIISFIRSTNCPLSHPRFMLLPFLSVYMNRVPEKTFLLGPWLNNTEGYDIP